MTAPTDIAPLRADSLVFDGIDGSQVFDSHAQRTPAVVMDMETIRDLSASQKPGDAMSELHPAFVKEDTVSTAIDCSSPGPAFRALIDLRSETLFDGSLASRQMSAESLVVPADEPVARFHESASRESTTTPTGAHRVHILNHITDTIQ